MGERNTTADVSVAGSAVDRALTTADRILRSYGRIATADLAAQKAAATDRPRTVVVVGELNRGKSSLVNALIGGPYAPVDVDVTTSATVAFVPASERRPVGSAELVFPGHTATIDATDLADWVTVDGRHVADAGGEALPTRAIVPVDSPHLRDMIVVDTPGAGGLDATRARLSALAAQTATVLVVATDAAGPLTAPEMAFVRDAVATVEKVIVVVTKTDKNLRRRRAVAEENERLLREHLHREVPVIGVSSVRSLAAAGSDRTERVDLAAGITGLRRLIAAAAAGPNDRPAADAMRTALEGLRAVATTIDGDLIATRDGVDALPELTAQRDRLTALKQQSAQWEQWLGRDLTLARRRALDDLDRRCERISGTWTDRISRSGIDVLRKNSQVFTAEIEAELLAAMSETVDGFIGELRRVAEPLFDDPSAWPDIEATIVDAVRGGTLVTGDVARKRQDLLDPSILTMGMIGTSMLGALIGVGAIAGVVWVGVNLGYKAMRAGKSHLLTWLRETVATARTATGRMLEAALAVGRPEIVVRYRDDLRTGIEQVQRQITEAGEAARLDAADREATIARLTKNRRVVDASRAELERLLADPLRDTATVTA
ncbi:dynamin family protein [Millisia brevis]|uniref:dynamin family protein n=1 Tax=Millisia brevis TaxID=264148 RepID=UPI000A4983AC|nr:dynamin family protein [Millisia brevis]